MNGSKKSIQKAAKTLLALGYENAANVLRFLDQDSTEKLVKELMKIDKLETAESRELLDELSNVIKEKQNQIQGGKGKARNLLIKTLGKEKAVNFLERLDKRDLSDTFRNFETFSPESIAQILSEEIPQTIALILTQFRPNFSAKILTHLPPKHRPEIARRIASMQKIHPEAVQALAVKLKNQLEQFREDEIETDGINRLSEILSFVDSKTEETILTNLNRENSNLVQTLREKLFSFEDLLKLETREIRRLVEKVTNDQIWAKALKGSGRKLSRHILACVSINRSEDITQEIELLGSIPLIEIENSRRHILEKAEELEKEGMLYRRKDREQMVE